MRICTYSHAQVKVGRPCLCNFALKLANFAPLLASVLIIVLSILTAIGFAALIHAVKRADIGYENDAGFHYGSEPLKVMPVVTSRPLTPNEREGSSTR